MKININDIKPLADDLMGHCQQKLGFEHPPELFFQEDEQNASKTLGKTAYYSPSEKKVVIYVTGRHGKDILRSLAHELVHHMQNCRGDLDGDQNTDPGYAQNDPHLRNMEAEAYLLGNMLFRDWEDSKKKRSLQENKENLTMNIDAIKKLVKEQLLEILQEKSQKNEAFGLSSKDKMDAAVEKEAEYNKRIDMKKNPPDPRTHLNKYGDPINPDGSPRLHSKSHGVNEEETAELEEECVTCPDLQEGSKPDFLDLDKDGDKKEPMKDAAKDAKGADDEEDEEEVNEAACGKRDDEALEEDWGGSSRPSDRGGYGWNRGSSGNESKCAAEAQRKTGTNHGPAYTRAKNDCLSRGQSYSNFEESNSEEATATIEEQEILQEDFWSQAQDHAEEACGHLSGDSYGMCFRREADKHYSYLIKQSQSGGGSSRYGSGRDHLVSFYEENQKVETPEHENNLYESRFRDRDSKLFEKLMNKWVK